MENYAPVNGLKMYYASYGEGGTPLILIHGSLMSSSAFTAMAETLSHDRQVIVPDLQAHGRTADIDRPLDTRQLAEDIAGLIKHLDLKQVDVFGFSLGGGITLQLAVHHAELLRKVAIASSGYNKDGWHPEMLATMEYLTPEALAGSPFEVEYKAIAPQPENWPALLGKIKGMNTDSGQATPEQVKAIKLPVFLLAGDSDMIKVDHMAEFFKLLGGNVPGDLAGKPASQLAILPSTTHIELMSRPEVPVLLANFLDAPITKE